MFQFNLTLVPSNSVGLCNRSLLHFLIYEENFVFFFISAYYYVYYSTLQGPSDKEWGILILILCCFQDFKTLNALQTVQ
jgi:hypothetical protein